MAPIPITVTSASDPRLADYVDLRDRDLRRLARGVFIAEGVHAIRELIASAYPVRSVLVTVARLTDLESIGIGGLSDDTPVYVGDLDVLRRVAGFDLHRGAVAAGVRPTVAATPADVLTGARRVVVLEGINDAENLGSLFRNAAGLGIDAVLLSPKSADPLYRRTIRVSSGQALRIPFATLDPWPATIASVLLARGFAVVALTPRSDAEDLTDAGLDRVDKLALLIGAEGPGLSEAAIGYADRIVGIPMTGGVDSLNVATAAAIAFFASR